MVRKIIAAILSGIALFAFAFVVINAVPPDPAEILSKNVIEKGLSLSENKIITPVYEDKSPESITLFPNGCDPSDLFSFYDSEKQRRENEKQLQIEPEEDTRVLQAGEHPITEKDLSGNQSPGNIKIKNETNYPIDANFLLSNAYPISYSNAAPLVLIVHTHGTECYMQNGAITYSDTTPTRSKDINSNVVGIGKVFAQTLEENGIPTLHCETMFDSPSYSLAYDESEKAVVGFLTQYPSIRYVFDIHRDSIVYSSGEMGKTVAYSQDGTPYAQAMFVVGSDFLGADHPNWLSNNMTVASYFQNALIESFPSLMRPINVRGASFNAEHSPGSLLIEIGTCGNSISEAQNTARFLAQTISSVIRSH